MIESANEDLDVDAIMQQLRDRVARLRARSKADASLSVLSLRNGVSINTLEAMTNIADQKSQVRNAWPSHAPSFFIFRVTQIRSLALRAFALLFKDQRHVNQALVAAFRESISLNRHLMEQIELIRGELEQLKRNEGKRDDDAT